MLISHRGNDKHNYKENTIDSIVFSLNQNYIDGVEFDIQLTKDNIVVLHHDFLYQNMQIEETTYNLLRLDKLEDLLKRLDTKKLLLIELKSKKNNIKFVEELDKILKKYNHLNIKLCSFNYIFGLLSNIFSVYSRFSSSYSISMAYAEARDTICERSVPELRIMARLPWGVAMAIHTVPTGFVSLPPVGPAIPVVAMA